MLFYALLVGVGGIIAHLASELGAMGSAAGGVLFSPRHWYLGLAALSGAVAFTVRARALFLRSGSIGDCKRLLHVSLRTLPFSGHGLPFFLFTGALQFAVGMSTEFGEGAPIEGHDVAAGVLGALIVVVLLAFGFRALARSLPGIVDAFVWIHATANHGDPIVNRFRPVVPAHRRSIWSAPLFNRPPPALQFG